MLNLNLISCGWGMPRDREGGWERKDQSGGPKTDGARWLDGGGEKELCRLLASMICCSLRSSLGIEQQGKRDRHRENEHHRNGVYGLVERERKRRRWTCPHLVLVPPCACLCLIHCKHVISGRIPWRKCCLQEIEYFPLLLQGAKPLSCVSSWSL